MKTHPGQIMAGAPDADAGPRPVVSAFLRYGVLISAIVIVLGLGLMLVRRGPDTFLYMPSVRAPESTDMNSLRAILRDLLPPRSQAVIEAGILLLIVTPVLSVGTAAVAFAIEGDWLYFLIAAFVFAVLLLGFALGGGGAIGGG